MKIKSFIRDQNKLVPIEVELSLWPGLPGIQFIGLPDQHLKESSLRIKSAIKASGFQFPVAQQILVNLRPSHLKKTSCGLDLAIAMAYLWETEQLSPPVLQDDFYVYGELTLDGEVSMPGDLEQFYSQRRSVVLTGQGAPLKNTFVQIRRGRKLSDISSELKIEEQSQQVSLQRPLAPLAARYSDEQARLLSVLAVGRHSCLMAGAAGSGKSTIAKAIEAFLPEPNQEEYLQLSEIHSHWGQSLTWRPMVRPHHSTPMMAMIGGGSVPFAGEISRAHGGVLVLDELLEFSQSVIEALREPFEERQMRVYRNGKLNVYPADTQILATTNLCPCGKWTPDRAKNIQCCYSNTRCRSHLQRLSGPLVDRFEALCYFDGIGELNILGSEILMKCQAAREFQANSFSQKRAATYWEIPEVVETMSPLVRQMFDDFRSDSQRRRVAVARIARTLAFLDSDEEIQINHWREAQMIAVMNFERLRQW